MADQIFHPNVGQVKILDFGISFQVTRAMTELVGEHQWQGTWPYMAPEQLRTRYGRENHQVDIWGFGVTVYQLLSGKLPFANKDQIKDMDEKPYELEGISDQIRNIVMKCLEKDREKRCKEMEEVLAALQAMANANQKPAKVKRIEPDDQEPQPGPDTKKVVNHPRIKIPLVRKVVSSALFAAAVGSSTPGTCAVPIATTSGPPFASSPLASAFARIISNPFTLLHCSRRSAAFGPFQCC